MRLSSIISVVLFAVLALVVVSFAADSANKDTTEEFKLEIKRVSLPDQETQIATEDLHRVAQQIKTAAAKGDSAQVKSLRSEAKAYKAVVTHDKAPVKTETVTYHFSDADLNSLLQECDKINAILDSI